MTNYFLQHVFYSVDLPLQILLNEEIAEITELIQDPDNLLAQDKLFLGYLARSQIKKLLSEGDISQFEYDNFFDVCQAFLKEAFFML